MKFKDMKLTPEKLEAMGIIESMHIKMCFTCKELTPYKDAVYDLPLCSEECMQECDTLSHLKALKHARM